MAKLIKLRYLVLALLAVAVIVSATAFSVSYAKWTGGVNTLSLSASTGEWKIDFLSMSNGDLSALILKECEPKPNTDKKESYGGIVIDNGTVGGKVISHTSSQDSCTINNITLKAGDSFVVAVFGRIWCLGERTGSGNGVCRLSDSNNLTNNVLDGLPIRLERSTDKDGNVKTVFVVTDDCPPEGITINLKVSEGGSRDWLVVGSDYDVVQITKVA